MSEDTATSGPEFVLADSFSYLNKGDAGIILGMMADIDDRFERPDYTILTETPDIDRERYPKGETMKSPFRGLYREPSLPRKYLKFAFTFVILLWGLLYRVSFGTLPCPGRLRVVAAYGEADAVLISGGDKYYDYDDGVARAIAGLPKLFEAVLAVVLGQRLMIYAHSAGPFENRYRLPLLGWLFSRADAITAREPVSKECFESAGASVSLTADSAFLAPDGDAEAARAELADHGIDPEQPIAGMTAREWHFPETEAGMSQYRGGIEAAARRLTEDGYRIVFFPQVIGPDTDDREISREIAGDIDGAVALLEDYDVPLLKELIGNCDVFVGTRMHSNIFALSKGVPTAAIAYRHKTTGIMRMFGQEDRVAEISDARDGLPPIIDSLLENRSAVERELAESLPEMRDRARDNSRYLSEVLPADAGDGRG